MSKTDERRASSGYTLLESWRRIQGQIEEHIDRDALQRWISTARDGLAKSSRLNVGDQVIGQVLSGSVADDDGTWPAAAVRDLIEEIASTDLEQGLYLGVINSRGVVTKDPAEGGVQERALADKYAGLAAAVSSSHPRTARMLRQISDSYRRDAQREDHVADLEQDLSG